MQANNVTAGSNQPAFTLKRRCDYCQFGAPLLNETTCSPCYGSQYYDSTTAACAECSTAIPHCLQCNNATSCTWCENGYGVAANGTCFACAGLTPNCQGCGEYTYQEYNNGENNTQTGGTTQGGT